MQNTSAKASYKLVYNRLKRLNKNGDAPIVIEVYHKKVRKYIPTGISIVPDQWNDKKQEINKKNLNHIQLNAILSNKINELEHFELQKLQNGEDFNLGQFNIRHLS